ncbi:MAG: beta-lactamase domain protein [Deltaproteobacteria bacterium]|jgi:glyoxylase-like metal-dependent hydrolase (beta-lactamase superfamily II)|nr:beta-lactamase domain protein [Deltaproteobacteria bacterium]
MKITETIHAFKHHFRLALGEGHYADRFVFSYILLGEKVCLIDTGVLGTAPQLQGYLNQIGRYPKEISTVLITHAHPDHIGGCLAIKKASSAVFYAHPADKRWIEDVERQYQERPILNFFELVEGSVVVNRELREGDTVSWDKGKTIRVLETPGHSPGSISYFYEEEGALFTGDAVPVAGTLPIYVDPQASIESIRKLQKISPVKHLLSSWHEPISGNQIHTIMENGIHYIQEIDEIVVDLSNTMPPETSGEELSLQALQQLGIKTNKVLPMVRTSFESHRKK